MPVRCPWTCAAPKLLSSWVAWMWTCRHVPSPTRGGFYHTGWSCLGRWGPTRQHDASPHSVKDVVGGSAISEGSML